MNVRGIIHIQSLQCYPDIMSMITATVWVARGAAAAFPTKYDVDEDELARISKLAKLKLDDAKDDLDDAEQRKNTTASETSDIEDGGTKLPQSQA